MRYSHILGKHSCIILFEIYSVRYTGRFPAKIKWEVLDFYYTQNKMKVNLQKELFLFFFANVFALRFS